MGIDSSPADYASLSLAAMLELQIHEKPNLVYKWSQSLTRKPNGTPVLQMNRMPFGLLQYQIEFFSCTNTSQFRMWIDTMESEFGGRFMKLFRAPVWSGMDKSDYKGPTKVPAVFSDINLCFQAFYLSPLQSSFQLAFLVFSVDYTPQK